MGKKYTICFAGDTSLGDWFLKQKGKKNEFERLTTEPMSFFHELKPLVTETDHFILNLETVLEQDPPQMFESKKYPNWDDPVRTLTALKSIGVTAVSLCNNHTMDFGEAVMLRTKKRLEEAGVAVFGAGKDEAEASEPYRITLQGEDSTQNVYLFAGLKESRRYREKYGFIAGKEKPGVNSIDDNKIKSIMEVIRKEDPNGILILYPHWQGQDYLWASDNEDIKAFCMGWMEAGADVIIGHGTHTVDTFARNENGLLAYSIGNFVYNSPGRYNQLPAPPYSFVIRVEFEEREGKWAFVEKVYPILTDNRTSQYRSRPVQENEALDLKKILSAKVSGHGSVLVKQDDRGFYLVFENEKKETSINTEIDYSPFMSLIGKSQNVYTGGRFVTSKFLADEFDRLGYTSTVIKQYLVVDTGFGQFCFHQTDTSNTSLLGARILKNKDLARKFLQMAGVNVAKSKLFKTRQKEAAEAFAMSLKASVIKPVDGKKGIGITVGIADKESFESAWRSAIAATRAGILIEEQFLGGNEARYLVVGNRCVAVVKRIPPHVIGNGVDSIGKLISDKNAIRKKNPNLQNKMIELNPHRLSVLKGQGLDPLSIPEKNQPVLIDWKGGLSTGADSLDITDEVNPLFKKIAEQVSLILPGLDVIGVDILARDHESEPNKDNYIIVEANTLPGIGGHHFPAYGKPRNAARAIAEHCASQFKKE